MATRSRIRLELDDRGLTPGRRTGLRRHVLRWSEWLLILVGVLCLAYFLYTYIEARLYQAFEDRELDEILSSADNDARAGGRPRRDARSRPPAAWSGASKFRVSAYPR